MASESILHRLGDLTFTAEKQGVIFTLTVNWEVPSEDCDCSLVGKIISKKILDDNAIICAFQAIWKNEKVLSISELKPNIFMIKFSSMEKRNDILRRGSWSFKKE
ncbi:hypothetical protein HRI_004602900 [Hibiscus trionum]|uniref:DUF4283 domain-containing protein n=1 Tax=Hibiscus trionum TaxID=183268 RepID=A0A9W7J707_HIBTR|nr:hypothetical protein HRI_004602900 [Hibiscus trionum]